MIFEKVLRPARNAARSQGAYFGVSVASVPDTREADFLWVMAEDVDFDNGFLVGVKAEGTMRRLFACESASPGVVELTLADRSTFDALFTSFDESEVVDLLPIPFRRALNFRFVAFMAVQY